MENTEIIGCSRETHSLRLASAPSLLPHGCSGGKQDTTLCSTAMWPTAYFSCSGLTCFNTFNPRFHTLSRCQSCQGVNPRAAPRGTRIDVFSQYIDLTL